MADSLDDLLADDRPLTIEVPREPRATICDDCGRTALDTTGFVYRGGDAFAIYHATLHRHGQSSMVDLGIGIGHWRDDRSVADVSAFMEVWTTADEIQFGFSDPVTSAWGRSNLLQNALTADAARASNMRHVLMTVAELVVKEDPSVARHLA